MRESKRRVERPGRKDKEGTRIGGGGWRFTTSTSPTVMIGRSVEGNSKIYERDPSVH